jgi:hypothetical protein
VNSPADAALGWAGLLPEGGVAKGTGPPAEDPERGTALVVLAPAIGTAAVVVLGSTVVTEGTAVALGSVVVTFGTAVVTGNVVVTSGIVVVTGSVVVTFGMVTGSVVVTLGSVAVTGSVVETCLGAVVIVTSGTAERPGMAVLARKPRRRTTARAAARLTSYGIPRLASPQSLRGGSHRAYRGGRVGKTCGRGVRARRGVHPLWSETRGDCAAANTAPAVAAPRDRSHLCTNLGPTD